MEWSAHGKPENELTTKGTKNTKIIFRLTTLRLIRLRRNRMELRSNKKEKNHKEARLGALPPFLPLSHHSFFPECPIFHLPTPKSKHS